LSAMSPEAQIILGHPRPEILKHGPEWLSW